MASPAPGPVPVFLKSQANLTNYVIEYLYLLGITYNERAGADFPGQFPDYGRGSRRRNLLPEFNSSASKKQRVTLIP